MVDGQLQAVHAVDVVKAHVILMVVLLEDDRTTAGVVTGVPVGFHQGRQCDHRQRELEAIQFFLHVGTDGELDYEDLEGWRPVHKISFSTGTDHVRSLLRIIEVFVQNACQDRQSAAFVQSHLHQQVHPESNRDVFVLHVLTEVELLTVEELGFDARD